MSSFTESVIEQAALAWIEGLGWAVAHGPDIAPDTPGGLVVDYIGLAQELKAALATYTESGGTGRTALDQAEAVAVMQEKYELDPLGVRDEDALINR